MEIYLSPAQVKKFAELAELKASDGGLHNGTLTNIVIEDTNLNHAVAIRGIYSTQREIVILVDRDGKHMRMHA